MPRKARFTIENGTYHVMIRGNNRNEIFHSEEDFEKFPEIVKENKKKFRIKIYHYALMNNHAHLIINSPTGTILSNTMKRINIMYTKYYRKKHGGIGHFFQDRFKSFLIQDGTYLLECGRYVELNPVRAGTVKECPGEYKWSSYRVYGEGKKDKIVNMNPEYEGLSDDKEARKRIYQEYVRDGLKERRNEERFFRMGAYGAKGFIEELKSKGLKSVWSHTGRPPKRKE